MTHFEFVSVAVSIILSFCLLRLLDGLRSTFARDRRYWVHATWVVTKLLNVAMFWWALWSFREYPTVNLATFVWLLVPPTVLYLQAGALVTADPGGVTSWRERFYEARRFFFGANIVLTVSIAVGLGVGGVAASHPMRLAQLVPLLLSVAGVASASPRIHGFIAVAVLANLVLGFGNIFFGTGAIEL